MRNTNTAQDISQALLSHPRSRAQERMQMLGIPAEEMSASVSFALSALLEKLDDVNRELSRTKENLAELEQLVDVDCIAPIPNRRAFMRRLSWAIAMHERYQHPSSILYFDLNEFKHLNDNYGHAAGDAAIRHISQILAGSVRESDFIARIGGDEFAIIMYYADEKAARKLAAKVVDIINGTPMSFGGHSMMLSAAVGQYTLKPGDDAESALAEADMAMYLDKRRGKSGVEKVAAS